MKLIVVLFDNLLKRKVKLRLREMLGKDSEKIDGIEGRDKVRKEY